MGSRVQVSFPFDPFSESRFGSGQARRRAAETKPKVIALINGMLGGCDEQTRLARESLTPSPTRLQGIRALINAQRNP